MLPPKPTRQPTLDHYSLLIHSVRDRLHRLARRLTGDGDAAEDVVQDVLMKGWDDRQRILGLDNPPAWLLRMTRHRAIDHLRARRIRHHRESDAAPTDHDGRTPYQRTANDDALHHVHRLLARLPAAQRTALRLREVEGLEYKEIARRSGQTMAQVKTNIHRGRQRLRTLLTQENIIHR